MGTIAVTVNMSRADAGHAGCVGKRFDPDPAEAGERVGDTASLEVFSAHPTSN